jgi:hypothetical protein
MNEALHTRRGHTQKIQTFCSFEIAYFCRVNVFSNVMGDVHPLTMCLWFLFVQIAAALPEELEATAGAVLATLRAYGIVPPKAAKPKKGKRGDRAGGRRNGAAVSRRRISPTQLRELWEEFGDEPEGLNTMAMQLGLPVADLQKLLIKHRIGAAAGGGASGDDEDVDDGGFSSNDDAGGDSGAGVGTGGSGGLGVSPDDLKELYERFSGGGEGYLELISEQLPGDPGPRKVLKWLKAAGLVGKKQRQKSAKVVAGAGVVEKKRRLKAAADARGRGERFGREEGAAAAGAVEVQHIVRGAVPQPQPRKVLGYLSALQKDHLEHGR